MTFKLPVSDDISIKDSVCAVYNKEQDLWEQLSCSSAQNNISINNYEGQFMMCCSNQLGSFTVMERSLLEVESADS